MIRKCNWNELELGRKLLFEFVGHDHKFHYKPVKVIDLTDKKVVYEYEDHWKEYVTKSQWSELYLYIDDGQMVLDL